MIYRLGYVVDTVGINFSTFVRVFLSLPYVNRVELTIIIVSGLTRTLFIQELFEKLFILIAALR